VLLVVLIGGIVMLIPNG